MESTRLLNRSTNLVFCDNSKVNLDYYKTKYIRGEVNMKSQNIRRSYTDIGCVGSVVDITKTRRAYRANAVHAHDAAYMRRLVINTKMLCVHDTFAIPILSTCLVIDWANIIYKEPVLVEQFFNTKNAHLIDSAFSIFIIL